MLLRGAYSLLRHASRRMASNSASLAEVVSTTPAVSASAVVSTATKAPVSGWRMTTGLRQRATAGLGLLLGAEVSSLMFGARMVACEGGAAVDNDPSAKPEDAKPDGVDADSKIVDLLVGSLTKVTLRASLVV
eukprot:8805206-Pyramimonas_sp.AAC.1